MFPGVFGVNEESLCVYLLNKKKIDSSFSKMYRGFLFACFLLNFLPFPVLLSFIVQRFVCFGPRPARVQGVGGGGDEYLTNLKRAVRVTVSWPPDDSSCFRNLHLSKKTPKQPKPHPLPSRRLLFVTLESDSQPQTGVGSYEDLGERVSPGAADVALGWVERHVVDGLLELLAVGGELLDARLALHVPQTDRAVVAWEEEEGESQWGRTTSD